MCDISPYKSRSNSSYEIWFYSHSSIPAFIIDKYKKIELSLNQQQISLQSPPNLKFPLSSPDIVTIEPPQKRTKFNNLRKHLSEYSDKYLVDIARELMEQTEILTNLGKDDIVKYLVPMWIADHPYANKNKNSDKTYLSTKSHPLLELDRSKIDAATLTSLSNTKYYFPQKMKSKILECLENCTSEADIKAAIDILKELHPLYSLLDVKKIKRWRNPSSTRGGRTVNLAFEADIWKKIMIVAIVPTTHPSQNMNINANEAMRVVLKSIVYNYDIIREAAHAIQQETKWQEDPKIQKLTLSAG
jgi:hypothetical protein